MLKLSSIRCKTVCRAERKGSFYNVDYIYDLNPSSVVPSSSSIGCSLLMYINYLGGTYLPLIIFKWYSFICFSYL